MLPGFYSEAPWGAAASVGCRSSLIDLDDDDCRRGVLLVTNQVSFEYVRTQDQSINELRECACKTLALSGEAAQQKRCDQSNSSESESQGVKKSKNPNQ